MVIPRTTMSSLEWIATLLGIACVALAAMRNVWTFPTGIGSVVLLGIVVFEARLYSDAALQVFFAVANLYGWVQWRRAKGMEGEIAVRTMATGERMRWAVATLAGWLAWGALMHSRTDAAYPWWDAAIAAVSIAAQLLMGRRRIENWCLWIAVDVASVPLYLIKELYLFAGLYLIYLALAVGGLMSWHKASRGGREAA